MKLSEVLSGLKSRLDSAQEPVGGAPKVVDLKERLKQIQENEGVDAINSKLLNALDELEAILAWRQEMGWSGQKGPFFLQVEDAIRTAQSQLVNVEAVQAQQCTLEEHRQLEVQLFNANAKMAELIQAHQAHITQLENQYQQILQENQQKIQILESQCLNSEQKIQQLYQENSALGSQIQAQAVQLSQEKKALVAQIGERDQQIQLLLKAQKSSEEELKKYKKLFLDASNQLKTAVNALTGLRSKVDKIKAS